MIQRTKNLAWSVGVSTFNEYDTSGALKAKWTSRYLHIFTRRPGEDWKLRCHVVPEDNVRERTPPAEQKKN